MSRLVASLGTSDNCGKPLPPSRALQGELQGLQELAAGLAQRVDQDREAAAEAVAPVESLDKARRGVESACATLREAAELSGLFIRVEDAFTAGELSTVAGGG